jgi:hypothetical protein
MSDFIQWLGTPEAHNVRHGLALVGFFATLGLLRFVWSLRPSRVRAQREYDREVDALIEWEYRQKYGSS